MKTYTRNDFLKSHFEEEKFILWKKQYVRVIQKLRQLKRQKSKIPYISDMYSQYMQMIENFFINSLFISTNGENIDYLFISNKNLSKEIRSKISDDHFIDFVMDSFVFGISDKSAIHNYKNRRVKYVSIFKEITNDYIKDYNFLNSAKHGYRIRFFEGKGVSINGQPIIKTDTHLQYYTREQDQIYEHTIQFNHKRIALKIEYILSMILNSVRVFNSRFKKTQQVRLDHIYLLDPFDKDLARNTPRFKTPIRIV